MSVKILSINFAAVPSPSSIAIGNPINTNDEVPSTTATTGVPGHWLALAGST
ncbi:hypothetical protein HUU40_22260 [candidate division KSB1 bacterium]|nr:hypothetical protein [candidate division KSB1 bacterium]